MVLFRHISLRERWAHYYRPAAARLLAVACLGLACLLVLSLA